MIVVLFRSKLVDAPEGYSEMADEMEALARTMPGFIDVKAYLADDGAGVGLAAVTSSWPELHAAVTATRASPAMNRAGPRCARPAGRDLVSGVMQEATAHNHRGSGGRPSGGQHQTEEPGPRTAAGGIRTCRHRGGHRRRGLS